MNKKEAMYQIEQEIIALSKSSLFKYRQENGYVPVIGEGSLAAKIMFVGEAPGKTEAETGKPFCGRSGKFLDEMLASIGLERKNVYITSVVKDRPQDNRDPTPKEIALYGPYLDRQLEIIKPKIVVLLGRIGMKYIFKLAGAEKELSTIGAMHGKVYEGKLSYGKVILLPMYHPAAALYNSNNKQTLLNDFKIVKRYINKKPPERC